MKRIPVSMLATWPLVEPTADFRARLKPTYNFSLFTQATGMGAELADQR